MSDQTLHPESERQAALMGAHIVRVHRVREMVDVVRVADRQIS